MIGYRELDQVTLRASRSVTDNYGGGRHALPSGAVGTITALLSDAFEVEFVIRPPRVSSDGEILDYGSTCIATLTRDQVAPA